MRYLVILSFIAVLFTQHVFAEESFDGSSSIDPPITEITPKKPTIMNVKFQYTSGSYALNNFTPIIEISPEGAGKFVQIDVDPIEIQKGQIRRIPVTLTIDPGIEHEKIFLSISFIGNHFQTSEPYKSSWNESLTLDIAPRDVVGIALGDCELVNINYEISGGDVFTACKKQDEISFKAIIDADSEGSVTFDIPTNMVYGLSSKDCKLDNTFFVLMDGKESVANIVGKKESNLVTVEFTTGIHEIKVIGFTIIPSPSPAQYCGIVMDYESQFLPPKQQSKRGVELRFIQCNEDYQLVEKYDGSPACVKLGSIQKLIKRGWAELERYDKNEMIELFQNAPEVKAFYSQYENVNMSVREDHVSYFAGSEDGFLARMKMFFDENYTLDHIELNCYFQKVHQFEFAQEDIVSKLGRFDCRQMGD